MGNASTVESNTAVKSSCWSSVAIHVYACRVFTSTIFLFLLIFALRSAAFLFSLILLNHRLHSNSVSAFLFSLPIISINFRLVAAVVFWLTCPENAVTRATATWLPNFCRTKTPPTTPWLVFQSSLFRVFFDFHLSLFFCDRSFKSARLISPNVPLFQCCFDKATLKILA